MRMGTGATIGIDNYEGITSLKSELHKETIIRNEVWLCIEID